MISSVSMTRQRRIRSIAAVLAVGAAVAAQLGSGQVASAGSAGVAGVSIGAPPICVTTDVYVTDNSAFGANNGGLISCQQGGRRQEQPV
jgi:hypothetical protein